MRSRVEGFRYELLDNNDNILGDLHGVEPGGNLAFSVYTAIKGTGAITIVGKNSLRDWGKHRIRISYVCGDLVEPLITAIPQIPILRAEPTTTTVELGLADKLLIPASDSFETTFGLQAGTNIIDAVRTILATSGVASSTLAITDSDVTLAASMVWDASDDEASKLRIINDLLDAAGYMSLWCDGLGRFRAEPYVEPLSRPVAWTFEDTPNRGSYLPDWQREQNTIRANKFIAVQRAEPDTPPLVATAIDQAAFDQLGWWFTVKEADIEAANQEILDLIAARRLDEITQTWEKFTISHPHIDGVTLNSAVSFANSRIGRSLRAVVQRQEWTLAAGGLIASTMRGI